MSHVLNFYHSNYVFAEFVIITVSCTFVREVNAVLGLAKVLRQHVRLFGYGRAEYVA